MLKFAFRHHVVVIAALIGLVLSDGDWASTTQEPGAATTSAPTAQAATPPAPGSAGSVPALASITPPMSATRVVEVLDQTVDWDRTLGAQQKAADEPGDMMFLYDNRQTASKVMGLAFGVARADADMLAQTAPAAAATDPNARDSGESQSLTQMRANLDAQASSVKAQLDAERRTSGAASPKSRAEAQAKINALQGELDLVTTRQAILKTMSGFSAGSGQSAGDLKAQIDAMAAAMPSTNAPVAASAATATPGANTSPSSTSPMAASAAMGHFGLWDLASEAFRLSSKGGTIKSVDERTVSLQKTLEQIRSPLIAQIQALLAQGNALTAQAGSTDIATLNGIHDQLDALAEQFKQASAVLLPLGQENLLLDQYRRNLSNWRDSIKVQFRDALKALAVRLGVLLVVLTLVFIGAELWRRAVMRYIQDTRRRYQLLLLRRIALWVVVVIIIGIAFATELGSIVTFAGLITAGVAVAMQSVLVSIVGYFFLVGKYGIRVGDRIQIGDVSGEVIDQGLVRMYLMELGGKGTTGPTGRVVAFANSVVFQVSSGLFKQIPGVNFTWRELVLNLPTGSNYSAIKESLLGAVTDALGDYRAELTRQTQEIERTTLSGSTVEAKPEVHLQFAASGVEAHVRYPVHLAHAADIDERVTEALARIMSTVKSSPGGT